MATFGRNARTMAQRRNERKTSNEDKLETSKGGEASYQSLTTNGRNRKGGKDNSYYLMPLSPSKRNPHQGLDLSSKIISPENGTSQNSPKKKKEKRYFSSPKKHLSRLGKNNGFHSLWSSSKSKQIGAKTQHDREQKMMQLAIKKNGKYDSSTNALRARSENTIVGKDSLDGVEISLKPQGVELIHVMGSIHKGQNLHDCDVGKRYASSALNMIETVMEHTTDVHIKGLQEHNYTALKYHAVCDFNPSYMKHRVPIKHKDDCQEVVQELGFQGKLAILEKYPILREERAIEEELLNLWYEIRAIEKDRKVIIQKKNQEGCNNPIHSENHMWTRCAVWKCTKHWDIDVYLDGVNRKSLGFKNYAASISNENRKYLQLRRGAFLHAGFKIKDTNAKNNNRLNTRATNILKTFATKCGGNPNSCGPHKHLQYCQSFLKVFGIQLVSTNATTVRHLAVLGDELHLLSSFFVSKDDGRCYYENCLPPRLIERWKNESIHDPESCFGRIRYLSCGPQGSYYAELVSGQSIWCIGKYDEAFRNVMDTFQVHRIAFGSFELDSSWIVLSKDGQVIWRNIPPRLQQILLNRKPTQAAPCEISLGYEGAYFVRFLDGEINYHLPSFLSLVVNKILLQGAEVTNIIMNVNAPDAFIIRHTQLPQ